MMTHSRFLDKSNADIPLDAERLEVFEQIVARFENDWHRNRAVRWQDYLPEDAGLRALLVAELPEIEAEFKRRDSRIQATDKINSQSNSASSHNPLNQPEPSIDRSFSSTANYQAVLREFRGGLGDVFVIRDVELNRVVVVKQLQARWLGNERAERAFEREVKITSLLEHPSIVPVHAVGKTSDGRPFYSMRYIEGQTLQQAIEHLHQSSRLEPVDLRNLLTHFVQICRTVAFANSCGIIHRDLKPTNIVIGQFGQTMILDWGLAKELQKPGKTTNFSDYDSVTIASSSLPQPQCHDDDFMVTSLGDDDTHRGQTTMGDIVGTPAYMSPEQALGDVAQYSVRTDVFGLGAVLYSILFGRPPFVGKDASETISLAAEGEPDYTNCKTKDAMARGLIAICRKAMSRESSMRYADAQSLADDLENWLAGENIEIQSQPLIYRLGKAATRQRTLATIAGLLLIATIVAVVSGIQAVQAERIRTLIASNESKDNARVAKNVAEYIAKVYRSADPIRFDDPGFASSGADNTKSTLKSILDRGCELIDGELQQFPETYAQVTLSLGTTYRGVGEYEKSRRLLSEASETREKLYGSSDIRTLECSYEIARLNYETGDYSEAESMLRSLIQNLQRMARSSRSPSAQPPDMREIELLLANAEFQLGFLLYSQPLGLDLPQFNVESVSESQKLFREVIEIRKRHLPKNHRSIGLGYAGLSASLICIRENEKEALAAAATAMEIFNKCNQENAFGSFLIEYNKAENLRLANKYSEAEIQYAKLSTFIANQVGEQHPLMAVHRWNLAGLYRKFGKMDKAEATIANIRSIVKGSPAIRSSAMHLDGLRQYAEALVEKNRAAEAIEIYTELVGYAQERPKQNSDLIAAAQLQLNQLRSQSN